jgi:chemotaxis protein MotB
MAVKRQKKVEPGAPQWVVTYGDLMSLLLCFFVLLQIFSEFKDDKKFEQVVAAVQKAFGFSGAIGTLPVENLALRSLIVQLEQLARSRSQAHHGSDSIQKSIEGPNTRVTTIRDGVVFTLGGPSTFDEFSAEIKPAVREELAKLAVMLAGRRNKIVIRGHAALKHLPPESSWRDLDDLSYARARSVMAVLLEMGLDNRVFRVEAVGTREPVRPRALSPVDTAENRRVEVILTEELVEEANRDAHFTNPNLARGV